jgi:hypothetical protein
MASRILRWFFAISLVTAFFGPEKTKAQVATVQPLPAKILTTVASQRSQDSPPDSAGREEVSKSPTDERNTFEASGYLGTVFDNFAPNAVGGYANQASGQTKNRFTAGVDAELRLAGSDRDDRQLWISSQTLHGMRSADVDCVKTPEAAICKTAASNKDKFLYILEHASTMEAHIQFRFEFARLQAQSDTPIKAYVFSRFGFLALDSAPRVFNSDTYAGIGLLAPKGLFKGSFAQAGWGRSQQFQSYPDANRLKIFGTLAFNLVPGKADQAQGALGRIGAGSRAFIAIVVDRNPKGKAPDAVQTYVGYSFDIARALGSE